MMMAHLPCKNQYAQQRLKKPKFCFKIARVKDNLLTRYTFNMMYQPHYFSVQHKDQGVSSIIGIKPSYKSVSWWKISIYSLWCHFSRLAHNHYRLQILHLQVKCKKTLLCCTRTIEFTW